MLTIRYEAPSDQSAIEDILDRCFGKGRRSKVSYRYREGVECVRELCMVAELEGCVVGTIRYWPVRCGAEPALLLGPLGIEPSRHNQGIGRAMVNRTLAIAAGGDVSLVFLVGDPGYYTRFQFIGTPPNIVMPGEMPHRLQHRVLGSKSLPLDHSVIGPWPQRYTSLGELPAGGEEQPRKDTVDPAMASRMIAEVSAFN